MADLFDVSAAGTPLACLICGYDEGFVKREVQMVTSGTALLDTIWANKTAFGAVCQRCGFVHTFLGRQTTWKPRPDS